jgi:hypothetical protein
VVRLIITGDKIAALEAVADAAHIGRLDVTILDA